MVMIAEKLHPAQRRRMAAAMPEPVQHDVILRPLGSRLMTGAPTGGYGDVIHTSRSAKWTQTLLDDLEAPDWQAKIRAMLGERRADGTQGLLELHLPIHKRFQVALFEVVCKRPGTPRLDPRSITGSGIVLRRQNAASGTNFESWTTLGGRRIGWKPADERTSYDPDAVQRRNCHKANSAVRAAIAANKPDSNKISEAIFPLHVAPPSVCEARGKTILFGLIPVASNESEDELPPTLNYATLSGTDRTEMVDHLSSYLKQRSPLSMPKAGQVLNKDWNVLTISPLPLLREDEDNGDPVAVEDNRLRSFGIFLHQLNSELGLFGNGAAAQKLRAELAQIALPLSKSSDGRVLQTTDALSFVTNACAILLEGRAAPQTTMPVEWPRVPAQTGDKLTKAALDCLSDQFAAQRTPTGKFERKTARYAIKGFVRIRGHGDCPDHIVWSGYSEPFRILQWWEGDGPGTKISLPAMDQLRKMKPNVTFDVPPSISKILQGDMKKLGKGEDPGGGMEIGWLCSFSIPIITLCAFIVLHIFLSLLDFIFRWMLWIKICIPIPKSKQGE
ncbi:MAG: hypothetical protein RL481_704 [Pseudomonadota bacterium]